MNLREKIVGEIRELGPMRFSRYMELCLYEPALGYYSRNAEQFGKAGDFYTSSDVHAVFARLLARQFEEIWRLLGSPGSIEVLELGPGRGLFARDLLDWSAKKFPGFFAALHYSLFERSPALQERLRDVLGAHLSTGKASLAVASSGPKFGAVSRVSSQETPLIIFTNEFFDALPVDVVSSEGSLRIAEREGHLSEGWAPASSQELEFVDRYSVYPAKGERLEIGLLAQDYVCQLAPLIERGFLIAFDYGYTREEQLAGRHIGTIVATRKHVVANSPYDAPGEQDITAHVNFTALASAAEQRGMQTQSLVTQSQFLLGIGEQTQFADAFEECRLPQEHAKVALQLKHLITPAGMGESFHVLVASKGIDLPQAASLSGLNFGRNSASILR